MKSVDYRMQACACATMNRSFTTAALMVPVTHSLLPRHLLLSNLPPSLTATSHTSTFRGRFFSPYNFRSVSGPVTAGLGGFDVIGGGGSMLQDAGATALVIGGAYALVSTFDFLSERKLIEQNLSRKLVHILSGLLFMASWPIFSASRWARYFASVVPLTNCLRLVIHGLSLATDEGLIKSVTREGKPEELLRGPLYYVLVLIFSAVLFWRESPVGVISLAMMCGGDGIADIVGRRFGSTKIPYNKQKSWAGSLSMFVLGFLVSVGWVFVLLLFVFRDFVVKFTLILIFFIWSKDALLLLSLGIFSLGLGFNSRKSSFGVIYSNYGGVSPYYWNGRR